MLTIFNNADTHQSHVKPQKYIHQNINFSDVPLFFVEGFEYILASIYFLTLPFITGLLFLFFYIAGGDYNVFLSLSDTNSYIMTWAIGYEILAVLTLLIIAKNAISFSLQHKNDFDDNRFIIP